MPEPVLQMSGVAVVRDGSTMLSDVDWTVRDGERWVVLGPNGAGKSTLLHVAGASLFPSRGTVELLGERFGAADLGELRTRVGLSSSSLGDRVPPHEKALDVIVTAAYGVVGRWSERYDPADVARAQDLLGRMGLRAFADRRFGTLSEGERKRVLLARALMTDPELLLLDEPAAGLDLGAREALLRLLTRLAADDDAPPTVLVTHHVEEVPVGTTHALLLSRGRSIAAGPVRGGADRSAAVPGVRPAAGGRGARGPLHRPRRRPLGQQREVGDDRLVVAARDPRLADVQHHEPSYEHVVQVQHRVGGRPGAHEAAAATVVGVAQAGAEQVAEGGVVAVAVQVAGDDHRQRLGSGLGAQVLQRGAPEPGEHRKRGQRVGRKQPHRLTGHLHRRAGQGPAARRAGRDVLERQPAEQPDRLGPALQVGDEVGQRCQHARGAQPGQTLGGQLRDDEHVGLECEQGAAGRLGLGVQDVEVGRDHPQPRGVLRAGRQVVGPQGGRHHQEVRHHEDDGACREHPPPQGRRESQDGVRGQQREGQRADEQRQRGAALETEGAHDHEGQQGQHDERREHPQQVRERRRPPSPSRVRRPSAAEQAQLFSVAVSSTQSTAEARSLSSYALAW